jgi:hypothetical protein
MYERHMAFLGKTGSGKTFAAKGVVETLLATGAQCVIIDPTSAWWGLRLDREGKHPAFDRVIVMGGRHGDIPLNPDPAQAAAVAQLVCEKGLSVVLDTGDMTVGERTRWGAKFAETMYRKITGPLHLIIDEAHEFAPQGSNPSPEASIMLHAFKQLASGGRSRGVRLMLLTQRPAKLHKDVLTQVETLVAMRLIAPQDRKAVQEWIEGCGDPAQARAVLESLAQLKIGEGWVWSPEIDSAPHRVKFPQIKTFDSSKAPDGKAREVKLGEVDKDALAKLIEAAGEQIKADDPKHLRAKIAELERALKSGAKGIDPAERQRLADTAKEIEQQQYLQERAQLHERVRIELDAIPGVVGGAFATIGKMVERINEAMKSNEIVKPTHDPYKQIYASTNKPRPYVETPNPKPIPAQATGAGGQEIQPRHRKLINAIAWFETMTGENPSRAQVAARAGVSLKSSSFTNDLGAMRSAGLIDYPSEGFVVLTTAAGKFVDSGVAESIWLTIPKIVDPRHVDILEALRSCHAPLTRAELADRVGKSESSSAYTNDLGYLRTLKLIEYPSKGMVGLSDWLRRLS